MTRTIGAEARAMIDGFLDLAIANIGRWRVWATVSNSGLSPGGTGVDAVMG
jgi:hypothetical protein